MYKTFWQLERKPFEPHDDPRAYYPSEVHQGALLKMRYAVEERNAAALLVGPAGAGKTFVIRMLADQLAAEYQPFISVVFPKLAGSELLAYLANQLDVGMENGPANRVGDSVLRIERALQRNVEKGQHAVIVVDDAQALSETGALETIRLMTNFSVHSAPAWTVLLVAQTTFVPVVERMADLDDRLAVKSLLRALTSDETAAYVQHRLVAAGSSRPIFTEAAIDTMHRLGGGIVRKINRLGDLALLVGFAQGLDRIDAAQIEAVSDELVVMAAA